MDFRQQQLPLFFFLRCLVWFLLLSLLPFLGGAVAAHDLEWTETLLILKTSDTFQVDLLCDLDALALGVPPGTDSAALAETLGALEPAELEQHRVKLERYFARRVRVLFNDERTTFRVTLPEFGAPLVSPEIPSVFGLTARLEGTIPPLAETVQLRVSRSFPPLILTIFDQRSGRQLREPLPGNESAAFPLQRETDTTAASVTAEQGGRLDSQAASPVAGHSAARIAWNYLVLGFEHILPKGLDHILFVLGLFLLAARWRPLLWQVTAFTVAHGVTLALGAFDVVRLPPSIVEPLIALSITWVAIENLFTDRLSPWRLPLVFGFGLLHGLGFAGVLGELGLPTSQRLTALVSFNAGIELGQLAVLGLAFAVFGFWRHRPWYRKRLVIPASLVIAAWGLWWTLERVFGL